jgi:hypothetical protein
MTRKEALKAIADADYVETWVRITESEGAYAPLTKLAAKDLVRADYQSGAIASSVETDPDFRVMTRTLAHSGETVCILG